MTDPKVFDLAIAILGKSPENSGVMGIPVHAVGLCTLIASDTFRY